ncbi:hypothetical protein B0I72DRAFT_86761 [Yarrowia lipolytica]|jgi:hypothetical protein|uniref:YALI0D10527p n=2 Tax=Yarrowia lipolytica TaxID=4952 RepID=Q6C9K3_YARLI|nr:YALI0D10527p [Yarrowia lipolytica CLIB122]AOW03882.1 hypothetical protein YALI1_D13160g [Yarrowia lipolytica]KAB8283062.1 hypothetical protein BKA91DRAFT_83840 [Yarrowia lipolytica]KAE8168986.1 hypothetical protein BKA90DRAFT_90859 [Yarrowia lipolytica]RDW23817.1 hypothetical protein B0I71DRAFT_148691 [Yarrowia lipolytica]RDW30694.1 hypothetical protein B0I72DRAFT_86761 [Yarrowia lipolytica]|eukprot:XP_502659.1 YALI0D10527p [Yarrowia lipolytica CLIB122]
MFPNPDTSIFDVAQGESPEKEKPQQYRYTRRKSTHPCGTESTLMEQREKVERDTLLCASRGTRLEIVPGQPSNSSPRYLCSHKEYLSFPYKCDSRQEIP